MPGVANIALIILEYQLIMVQPQVVFCWESMSKFTASAHPRTSVLYIPLLPLPYPWGCDIYFNLLTSLWENPAVSFYLQCEDKKEDLVPLPSGFCCQLRRILSLLLACFVGLCACCVLVWNLDNANNEDNIADTKDNIADNEGNIATFCSIAKLSLNFN